MLADLSREKILLVDIKNTAEKKSKRPQVEVNCVTFHLDFYIYNLFKFVLMFITIVFYCSVPFRFSY